VAAPSIVHHFSEDPSIDRFEPHIPKTNPSQPPAVWAIDPEHSPLYWFPRNCPRVTAWPRNVDERTEFRRRLATNASRVHAIETTWLDRVRTTQLYRYDFDASDFAPWPEASGQWISREVVEPVAVTAMGNLVDAHYEARIELRLVPNLWPLVELVRDGPWDFGCVRLMLAEPPDIDTQ
jgi:hypothetical protein